MTRLALLLVSSLLLSAQGVKKSMDAMGGGNRGAGGQRTGGGDVRMPSGNPRGGDLRGVDRRSPGGPEGRVARPHPGGSLVRTHPNAPVVIPRPMAVCSRQPDRRFWGSRDIMAEIQWHARQGFVPVMPVDESQQQLSDVSQFPAGWKSYGFVVPPGGKLHVRLHHPNEGWFRLAMMNKWGNLEKGMLQNLIPTGNPEVSYTNHSDEVRAVYVLVDDPGWMSSKAYPYFLDIQRDWQPGRPDMKDVKPVQGIWAMDPTRGISAEHATLASSMPGRW